MSNRGVILRGLGIALLAFVAGSGCEALHYAGIPGMEPYLKQHPEKVEELRSHKEQFTLHRNHKSFYWLLAHKVSNGMPLVEVEEVFGEPGEYTSEFTMLKSDDGLHQRTDSAYRWGPDNEGFSAVIFFRDNRVINFNNKDYQIAKTPFAKPKVEPVDF